MQRLGLKSQAQEHTSGFLKRTKGRRLPNSPPLCFLGPSTTNHRFRFIFCQTQPTKSTGHHDFCQEAPFWAQGIKVQIGQGFSDQDTRKKAPYKEITMHKGRNRICQSGEGGKGRRGRGRAGNQPCHGPQKGRESLQPTRRNRVPLMNYRRPLPQS